MTTETYYVRRGFRSVSDGELGRIQSLWLDMKWTQRQLAEKYEISSSTVSHICRAIPDEVLKDTKESRLMEKNRLKRLKVPHSQLHKIKVKKLPKVGRRAKKKTRKAG